MKPASVKERFPARPSPLCIKHVPDLPDIKPRQHARPGQNFCARPSRRLPSSLIAFRGMTHLQIYSPVPQASQVPSGEALRENQILFRIRTFVGEIPGNFGPAWPLYPSTLGDVHAVRDGQNRRFKPPSGTMGGPGIDSFIR